MILSVNRLEILVAYSTARAFLSRPQALSCHEQQNTTKGIPISSSWIELFPVAFVSNAICVCLFVTLLYNSLVVTHWATEIAVFGKPLVVHAIIFVIICFHNNLTD